MNKKVLIAVIIIFIIIVAIILGLLFMNKNNGGVSSSGSQGSNNTQIEMRDIPTPEGYTKIENISSDPTLVPEAVFYKEEKSENLTYVRLHLVNKGTKPFSKDNVCTIAFYDESDNVLHRFGGIIEEGADIPVGGRTIINTKFLSDAGPVNKVEVKFDKPN